MGIQRPDFREACVCVCVSVYVCECVCVTVCVCMNLTGDENHITKVSHFNQLRVHGSVVSSTFAGLYDGPLCLTPELSITRWETPYP